MLGYLNGRGSREPVAPARIVTDVGSILAPGTRTTGGDMDNHEIRIMGGYDYDVYISCSCGTDLGRYHETLTLEDVISIRDEHLGVVNVGPAS
jgi:hypothetical protein